MSAVLLARIQFALTISFHYIFPPLTIGLSWVIFYFLSLSLISIRNKNNKNNKNNNESEEYIKIAQFWIKIFAITFVIGVTTGITMEFQFGTNWANYSRFVGDIFGAPLAAEAILAFFLESTFLGVLLYGHKKVSPKFYCFSSLMVAIGSSLSAFWIVAANSWQQTPAGFRITNGRAELTDFTAAIFNPSTFPRFFHVIAGAFAVAGFFVLGITAYCYLRKQAEQRNLFFIQKSFAVAIVISFISSIALLSAGHIQAIQVNKMQPLKMAAFEGLWQSTDKAPLLIFGVPDLENKTTRWSLPIPSGLSFLIGNSSSTYIRGLNDFDSDNYPPLRTTFFSFHAMVMIGTYLIFLSSLGIFLWIRYPYLLFASNNYTPFINKIFRKFLWITVLTIPIPFLGNELGWMAAEVGRQPWVVYDLLKTEHAISTNVSAMEIFISIILFSIIYLLLFALWMFLLRYHIRSNKI